MAINARNTILYVDVVTAITVAGSAVVITNFKPVLCLTSNGFSGTTSAIDATSKCSINGFAESIDGLKGWTMSGEGLAYKKATGVTTAENDMNDIFKLWRSGAEVWFMIADKTSMGTSVTIRYGVGRIDSDSDDFPDNEKQTFSFSITGIGEAYDQDDLA